MRRDATTPTIGTGPFGDQSTGTFNFEARAPRRHALYLEETRRRVRVVFNGKTIADSRQANAEAASARGRAPARLLLSRARTSAGTCSRRATIRRTAPSRATPRTGP